MVLDFPDWSDPVIPGEFTLAGQGVKLVAVTGTAVAIKASTAVKQVMVKARTANAGTIYLGSSTVTANETAGTGGLQLSPGDMVAFPVPNLAGVYINGTAGDGVSFAYWT